MSVECRTVNGEGIAKHDVRMGCTALPMLLLFLVSSSLPAAEALPAGVRLETHTGWENCLVMESNRKDVKLVIAPAIGGRIVHYSYRGENIIWENPEGFGKSMANTKTNFGVGGYQCDIGPELRPIPQHKELWQGVYQWEATKAYTVKVTSAPDASLGVQLEKEIVMDPETGDLGITQRMKNISDKEVSYCLWDRTLCNGGGYALIPLNKKSRFPARWSLAGRFENKRFYDGDKPQSSKIKIIDNVLVAKCEGEPAKAGADSDAGWIGYTRGRMLFVKYFPYSPKGYYSDGGNSVELYFDNFKGTASTRAELEPLSPEVVLRPGETYVFPEKWLFVELEEDVRSHEQARKLVGQVPSSPFKK
jgi:hypothetical protein